MLANTTYNLDGMCDRLDEIRATSSRNVKRDLLVGAAHYAWGEEFFALLRLAYDYRITFGVAEIPNWTSQLTAFGHPKETYGAFLRLCDGLASRELSGSAATNAITLFSEAVPRRIWDTLLRPVLMRDLSMGATETTINEATRKAGKPEWAIPTFGVMRAHDSRSHPKKMVGRKFVEFKLDGYRVISLLDRTRNTVTLLTREGKEVTQYPFIRTALERLLPVIPYSLVLDGELQVRKSFKETMRIANGHAIAPPEATEYALFDGCRLSAYQEGIDPTPLETRRRRVMSVLGQIEKSKRKGDFNWFSATDFFEVDLDTEKGKAALKDLSAMALSRGLEGLMVKSPQAPYETKKSTHWLKWKPFIVVSLTAQVVLPADKDSKYAGVMGAVRFSGVDEDFPGKHITVDVGGGWSDADRKDIWERRGKIPGMIADILADDLTTDAQGNYSLRFPRFKGWRGAKPGQKI